MNSAGRHFISRPICRMTLDIAVPQNPWGLRRSGAYDGGHVVGRPSHVCHSHRSTRLHPRMYQGPTAEVCTIILRWRDRCPCHGPRRRDGHPGSRPPASGCPAGDGRAEGCDGHGGRCSVRNVWTVVLPRRPAVWQLTLLWNRRAVCGSIDGLWTRGSSVLRRAGEALRNAMGLFHGGLRCPMTNDGRADFEARGARTVLCFASIVVWLAGCEKAQLPPVLNAFDTFPFAEIGSEPHDANAFDMPESSIDVGMLDGGPTAEADGVVEVGDANTSFDARNETQAPSDVPGADACGGRGEACCIVSCHTGLSCMGGRCLDIVADCGAIGRPCCILPAGRTNCNPGLGCAMGVCSVCGDESQVCCTPDTGYRCRGTLGCFSGVCMTVPAGCGRLGETCCTGAVCVPSARCSAGSGMCEPRPSCGDRGLPCCSTGLLCIAGICQSGTCLPPPTTCGRLSQQCCPQDQCAVLYRCEAGTCQLRTPTCGRVGLPCCPEFDGCGSAAICAGGLCIAREGSCGVPGFPCCPVPMFPMPCQPGVVCRDGTCRL